MKSVDKVASSVGSPLSERLMAGIGAPRSDRKRPGEIPLNRVEHGIRVRGVVLPLCSPGKSPRFRYAEDIRQCSPSPALDFSGLRNYFLRCLRVVAQEAPL